MHEQSVEIKPTTNIVKLFSAYVVATGLTDAKDIAAALDVPVRTVYRWLNDAKIGTPELAQSDNEQVPEMAVSARNGAPELAQPVPDLAKIPSRARAYKESPSEIVYKNINQQTTTRDLSLLNGSTDVVVGFVSSWMTAYYPDERDAAARTWIASEIARTSADAVKQAILLTANKIQRGEIVPKPLNYATNTATNICKEAAAAASTTGKAVTSLDRWKAKKALQNSEVAHG
ncbi:MAG: hypothetical protein RLZ60_1187 [Pseudomonadota bacterium]